MKEVQSFIISLLIKFPWNFLCIFYTLHFITMCLPFIFFSCFDCLVGMLHFRDILAKQVAFQILCISQLCTRCVNYSTCSTKLFFLFRSALSTVNLTNSTLMQISTEKINNFIFCVAGCNFLNWHLSLKEYLIYSFTGAWSLTWLYDLWKRILRKLLYYNEFASFVTSCIDFSERCDIFKAKSWSHENVNKQL